MSQIRTSLSVALIFFGLLSFVAYMRVQAQETMPAPTVVVEKPVIVTAVPAPKETLVTPTGFANCFTIKAGWYQDVWVAEHNVCQYANNPSGLAWIEGYWACNKYADGQCTNWEWKPARWEKTLVVY